MKIKKEQWFYLIVFEHPSQPERKFHANSSIHQTGGLS